MGVCSYYSVPERKMAGLMLILSAAFYVLLLLLTFVLRNCGGLSDSWAIDVWHVLNVGIEYAVVGLVAFALVVMFIVPLWFFWRRGKRSCEKSFDAAKKAIGLVFLMTLLLSVFIFPTIGMIADRDVSDRLWNFANYKEVSFSEFRDIVIPRTATDIKMHIDRGIGYRECDISCTVSKEGLLEFERENGYRFEHREPLPCLANNCVTRELNIDPLNSTNYLFYFAGYREDEAGGNGQREFGSMVFVYDIAKGRLYGSCSD